MGSQSDENPQSQVEAFLSTLRRSAEIAQELMRTASEQSERIRSLEGDLASARARTQFLEKETARLRGGMAGALPARDQLDQLLEEQNCLAHLFVASDRLARVASAQEAVDVADEVLHNLIGARTHGIFVRLDSHQPRQLSPRRAEIQDLAAQEGLIAAAISTGAWQQPAGPEKVPVAVPLLLERAPVGAIVLVNLVPQVGPSLGRLQSDLLRLLSDRLATSMCIGILPGERLADRWTQVQSVISNNVARRRGP